MTATNIFNFSRMLRIELEVRAAAQSKAIWGKGNEFVVSDGF
jgi:hypothetical protein